MTEICVVRAGRSRYIDKNIYESREDAKGRGPTWNPAPGFEKLVESFLRNKVEIKLTTAYFDHEDRFDDYYDHYGDIAGIINDIRAYCDPNCTGFWTMHQTYNRNKEFDTLTHRSTPLDTGQGRVLVCFENEADIEGFLANCAALKGVNKHPTN